MLRFEDGSSTTVEHAKAIAEWVESATSTKEVPFRPSRILMQDFTGVPAVVDLAAMRDGIIKLGGQPDKVNPLIPVDLVIDHSVMVDVAGTENALHENVELEFARNGERYRFLRWGSQAFENFRVVPPGTGICHQVNLEYLAQTVWTAKLKGEEFAYPDTLFGTDSHTTMVNGIAVLGWGVGGIEAEAAMLGQPIAMADPGRGRHVPHRQHPRGRHRDGRGADHHPDAARARRGRQVRRVLRLRAGRHGGRDPRHHRQHGPGIRRHLRLLPDRQHHARLPPPDRAGRRRASNSWRNTPRRRACGGTPTPQPPSAPACSISTSRRSSRASPGRSGPQDRVMLSAASSAFKSELSKSLGVPANDVAKRFEVNGKNFDIGHGDVVIAAITSCTNTSNPYVMVAAGLVARKARALGLRPKPWVKTSLAPGSQVVTEYLDKSGLNEDLDAMGFALVGYGCTTCIGNSGPLDAAIGSAIDQNNIVAVSVLSGNRNFEGRVHPQVRANYLASPPLVVAYSLLGTMNEDITTAPLGTGANGQPVYLKDIWPSNDEIAAIVKSDLSRAQYLKRYGEVFKGPEEWQTIEVEAGTDTYGWTDGSTYVKNPPYFEGMTMEPVAKGNIVGARVAGHLRRQHHHRPHQPRWQHQEILPGRRLPDRASGQPAGLQQLRGPPRQPRGHDAGHLRQHPHQERDAARRRRRPDEALPGRRPDADLRRGAEIRGRGRAAGRVRRQGIRHGLLA